jgi:predicted ATP-grasp superfamily ATP-dependent carboligase
VVDKYEVRPGRNIYKNGAPFIAIAKCGDTPPVEADEMAHKVCELLNAEEAAEYVRSIP